MILTQPPLRERLFVPRSGRGQRGWIMTPFARNAFNPASLFGGSDEGGFYDFTDAATLFSDTGRVTPATIGGTIGSVTDKSGKGRHLSGSSTSTMQSGYSDWPGSGNALNTAFAAGSAAGHTAIVAFRPDTITGSHSPLDGDYSTGATRVSQAIGTSGSSLVSLAFTGTAGSVFTNIASASSLVAIGSDYYVTMWRSTAEHVLRLNGTQVAITTTSTANPAPGNSSSRVAVGGGYIGTTNPNQRPFDGRIYAALWITRQLTGGELTDLEDYFRIKAGL